MWSVTAVSDLIDVDADILSLMNDNEVEVLISSIHRIWTAYKEKIVNLSLRCIHVHQK